MMVGIIGGTAMRSPRTTVVNGAVEPILADCPAR